MLNDGMRKSGLARLLAALTLMAIAACQSGSLALRYIGEGTQIIDLRSNKQVSQAELRNVLERADYVLLGEEHGNPFHHAMQLRIIELMIAGGRRPSVVFEMFNAEDAKVIATAAQRYPSDPDRIASAAKWEQSGWPDWSLYRPLVKTALDTGLPIVAGNFSRANAKQLVFNQYSRLDSGEILELEPMHSQMGLTEPLPPGETKMLADKLRNAHAQGGPMSEELVDALLFVQRVRDATLAESMIARNQGEGAILIAGREHARQDYGVPYYLRFREPHARVISITFVHAEDLELSGSRDSAAERGSVYDFVWKLDLDGDKLKAIH